MRRSLAISVSRLVHHANVCPWRSSPGNAARRFVFNGKKKRPRAARSRKNSQGPYFGEKFDGNVDVVTWAQARECSRNSFSHALRRASVISRFMPYSVAE